jgi:hypothetical protein
MNEGVEKMEEIQTDRQTDPSLQRTIELLELPIKHMAFANRRNW